MSTEYFWYLVVASVAESGRGGDVSGVTDGGDGGGGDVSDGRGGDVSDSGLVGDGSAVDNVGLLSVHRGLDVLELRGGVGLSDLLGSVGAGLVHKYAVHIVLYSAPI